jgi:hypothetical protein
MSKFLKNATVISATTTLAMVEGNNLRPAIVRGGYISRTGLTAIPMWVEEGAVTLLRKREFLAEILSKNYQGIPWYFTGHGAEGWQAVRVEDLDGLKAALAEWDAFRRHGGPVPSATSEEARMARAYTLHGMMEGCYLTDHEATELLPRWSTWAEMEEDEEDEDGVAARVWASRGHAWTADTKEGVWNFSPEGETSTWTDAEGWAYRSTLSVQARAWVGERTRQKEGRWEVQRCKDMTELCEWEDC